MPLRITAATSSSNARVNKIGRRASASPFSSAKRKKPCSRVASSGPRADEEEEFSAPLKDGGLIVNLANGLTFSDVAQLLIYISNHQFTPIPENGSGLNSTRLAEVLNFRRRLPPIVSVAHVHAMSKSATYVDREIATLLRTGVVRRLVLPGRGEKGPAIGEGLVLVSEWEKLIYADPSIAQEVKDRYINFLRNPSLQTMFAPSEVIVLGSSGFITRSAAASTNAEAFLRPGATTLGTLQFVSTAGSSHASGSSGAAADSSKNHISGGSGASARLSTMKAASATSYALSLPNMGPYLRMLMEARAHVISLLGKNKYREAPRDMLQEWWDGGIIGTDDAARARKARGEWQGVLPGRTKKWKQFYGLEFQWVLEECVGAGMVECFKTGSVGIGVRAI